MVVQDEPKVEKEPKIEKEPAKKVIVETNEGPVKPRTNTTSYNTNSKKRRWRQMVLVLYLYSLFIHNICNFRPLKLF